MAARSRLETWGPNAQVGHSGTAPEAAAGLRGRQRHLPHSGHLPPTPPYPTAHELPAPPASLLMSIPHQLSPQKQQGSPSLWLCADNQERVLISETVKVGKRNEGRLEGHMEPV